MVRNEEAVQIYATCRAKTVLPPSDDQLMFPCVYVMDIFRLGQACSATSKSIPAVIDGPLSQR